MFDKRIKEDILQLLVIVMLNYQTLDLDQRKNNKLLESKD